MLRGGLAGRLESGTGPLVGRFADGAAADVAAAVAAAAAPNRPLRRRADLGGGAPASGGLAQAEAAAYGRQLALEEALVAAAVYRYRRGVDDATRRGDLAAQRPAHALLLSWYHPVGLALKRLAADAAAADGGGGGGRGRRRCGWRHRRGDGGGKWW